MFFSTEAVDALFIILKMLPCRMISVNTPFDYTNPPFTYTVLLGLIHITKLV